eukprot:scaffold7546_cov189-Alexandrium_tamarense.AAC.5
MMLMEAIGGNDVLHTLILDDNTDITSVGWDRIVDEVFDATSIESLFLSNHTLVDVGWRDYYPLSVLDGNSGDGTITEKGRHKVFGRHFWGELEYAHYNLGLIIDLDVRLMPMVLEWIGRESCRSSGDIRICKLEEYGLCRSGRGFENEYVEIHASSLEGRVASLDSFVDVDTKHRDAVSCVKP